MHLPDDTGSTLFQRLDKERADTGKIDARLVSPPLPLAGEHLWNWFWQLDSGRGDSLNGLARISHGHIAEWSALTGNVVRDHEVQILLAMDRARREASNPEAIAARAAAENPRKTLSFVRQLAELKKNYDRDERSI